MKPKMKSLVLDTDESEFNEKDSELSSILTRIKAAVQMPLRNPYGKRNRYFEEYFSKFDETTLERFITKLSSSVWVKNPRFSLDMIVREDMVNTIFTSVTDPAVSKYYHVETLTLKPLK